ncbi:MAG: LysR family transcriptional regulator [Firmicutes bacterium]|nr:LysR family transcriptional regulator [Bacillota bacterium]
MRFDHLRCFVAIKKYRSFSEAAESLYISQSALSKQLKSFEDTLGVTLVERSHSVIKLTPIGERIAIYVQTILDEYDRMIMEAKDYLKSEKKKLRIASFCEMSQYGITDLMVSFEHNIPNFHIESKECDHLQMFDLLSNRQTDIIIGYRELWPEGPDYFSMPLKKDDLVLVVHESHPLAGTDEISLADLKQERFCFPREDETLFKLFCETCVAAGFAPFHTLSNVRLGTIKRYILQGMRVTLQTRIRATNFFTEPVFHLVNVKESPSLTLTLMANDSFLSELGRKFIQFAYGYYREQPQKAAGNEVQHKTSTFTI